MMTVTRGGWGWLDTGRWPLILRRLIVGALVGLLVVLTGVSDARAETAGSASIYFFWRDGCPHCAEAKPILEGLVQRYPGSELRAYEVWLSEENAALFAKIAAARGFEPTFVPTILIGERYWIGYSESRRRRSKPCWRPA
jgi:thiol-disulfide isomerase/thioredoxin